MKTLIILAAVLALTACGRHVTPTAMQKATEICPSGSVLHVLPGYRMGDGSIRWEAQCTDSVSVEFRTKG